MDAKEYYSRKEVQEKIVKTAKDREVAIAFGQNNFGKRPDILQYENDVGELANQGATSFHLSEEQWYSPLAIETGMSKAKLDKLRKGWDLILDVDAKFEFSTITAKLLIDALHFHDVKNISLKFSGGKGWHIGVPFSSFPEKIHGKETKDLFPEAPRIIAAYLENMIKEHLGAVILEKYKIKDIVQITGKKGFEIVKNDRLDPFSFIDIDTLLISSRHLFRAPYSLHEKSGLVSLPIKIKQLDNFVKEWAIPEKVVVKEGFLNKEGEGEANNLIIQAYDWFHKKKPLIEFKERKEFDVPKIAVKEDYFPPCIKKILKGVKEDGRKRALFILLNFFKCSGYSSEDIKKKISEWNIKNYNPLKEGYVISQLNWHLRQKERILPPNCDNANYYKGLMFCEPDNWCSKIKNPVNYAIRKINVINRNIKRKR